MANLRPRGSSIFSGLALIFFGLLLLLDNYQILSIEHVLGHWWPLILIFWGGIKLYERTAASRTSNSGIAGITAGEIFLILGLLSLAGIVVAVRIGKREIPGHIREWRNSFDFDLEVAPKSVPPDARVTIRNGHGSISVRPSDDAQIRVSGKKNAKAWNESDAQQVADRVAVEIVKNGDGYEIRPTGAGAGDSRISFDLDVAVPKKASLTIRNEKGGITVADMAKPVNVTNGVGGIEIRGTGGDVTIDTRKSDIKVSDTNGNIKISGHGGDINVSANFTGPSAPTKSRRACASFRGARISPSRNSPAIWRPARATSKSMTLPGTSACAPRTTSRWRTPAAKSKSTIAEATWKFASALLRRTTSKSTTLPQPSLSACLILRVSTSSPIATREI